MRKAEREEMLSEMQALVAARQQEQQPLKEILEIFMKLLQDETKKAQEETARIRDELRQKQMDELRSQAEQGRKAAEEAEEMVASAARGDKTLVGHLPTPA